MIYGYVRVSTEAQDMMPRSPRSRLLERRRSLLKNHWRQRQRHVAFLSLLQVRPPMSDSNVVPISDEQATDLRFRLDCKRP